MAKKKRATSRKVSARKPRKQQKKKSTRSNEKKKNEDRVSVRRLLQRTQLFYKEKRKWEAKAELDKTEAPFSSLEVDITDSSQTVSSEIKVICCDVKKDNPMQNLKRKRRSSIVKPVSEKKMKNSEALKTSEKKMKNLEAPKTSEQKMKNLEAPKTKEKKMKNLVAPKKSEEKMEKLEAPKKSEEKMEKLEAPKRTDILVEKKETPRQWNCPLCTFLNEPHHLSCSMCRTENPSGISGIVTLPKNHMLQQELRDGIPKADERQRRSARRKRQKSQRLVKFYSHKLQEDLKLAMELERRKNKIKSIKTSTKTNDKTTPEIKMKKLMAPKKRISLGVYHKQKAFKMKRKKVFLRLNTTSPRMQVNSWIPKKKIADRLKKERLEKTKSRKQDKIEKPKRPCIDLSGTTDEEDAVPHCYDSNKRNKKRRSSLLK